MLMLMRFSSTLLLLGVFACAHATLPGTQVRATEDNKEIYDLLVRMNEALINRDVDTLLSMVSPHYFEDNGTAQTDDDYGYHELSTRMLPESMQRVEEMQLQMELHDIVVEGGHAYADVRYQSRARLDLPSGPKWDSHKEFNRLEFERQDNRWLIVSGL